MRLVVGLGNPGKRYQNTRHNAGYHVLDVLVNKLGLDGFEENKKLKSEIARHKKVILAIPTTFMNSSGAALGKLVHYYKVDFDNLWVIHDDLDLRLGEYKIQKGKGPREHKGLISIYEMLGTKNFWHVRVGVGNRSRKTPIFQNSKMQKTSGKDFVLQDFSDEEMLIIDKVIDRIVKEMMARLLN